MKGIASMESNHGLTFPGPCESCGKKGPRFKFYNKYADPPINMDLCPKCMNKAFHCMVIFFQTPAGKKALAERRSV